MNHDMDDEIREMGAWGTLCAAVIAVAAIAAVAIVVIFLITVYGRAS